MALSSNMGRLPWTAVRVCSGCDRRYSPPLAPGWYAIKGVWWCPDCAQTRAR